MFLFQNMKKDLEKLSASTLRRLLIEEIKKFILDLDHRSIEDLQEIKLYLKGILHLLTEKERTEADKIIWGRNSTNPGKFVQHDSTSEIQRSVGT